MGWYYSKLNDTIGSMGNIRAENLERYRPADFWSNQAEIANELKRAHQPVNYTEIVANNRVLFLGENQGNRSIREHVARSAKEMKDAGITHYTIEAHEASNVVLERLNRGETVDLSNVAIGPGRIGYEEVIRAMASQGIQVVAIDIDQSIKPSREERETHLTKNINHLLQSDPNSKIAVLIEIFHTARHYADRGVTSVGKRLLDKQVPTVNVFYIGGEFGAPLRLTAGAIDAGLTSREFMTDFRAHSNLEGACFGKGEADWIIHLPRESYFYNRK